MRVFTILTERRILIGKKERPRLISPETTKTHIRNIYTKLDVHSNAELKDLIVENRRQAGLIEATPAS